MTSACLLGLWHFAETGTIFHIGIVAVTLPLLDEHRFVRPDDLSCVNVAFFQVNAVISIGLLVVGLLDLWVKSLVVNGK